MAAPAATRRPAQRGQQQAQARPRSFLIGTQDVLEGGDYDQTFTNTAGGSLQPWTLQATGWLARLWLRVDYTTTAGTLGADSPFFFNDTATTENYTLSLHDALPTSAAEPGSPA